MLYTQIDLMIMGAMKAHNEVRTRTLRGIKAALIETRTAKGAGELTEEREIQVLQKMVKQREDARQQYIDANRIELAKNEFEEMEIIKEFLPKPATREDIEKVLNDLKKNADTMAYKLEFTKANMGAFIRMVKASLPGADGALVASVVKENLS